MEDKAIVLAIPLSSSAHRDVSLDLDLGQEDPVLLTINDPIEVDHGAASPVDETRKRFFPCKTCQKTFPTSQALGGHQNAHKLQREQTKQREQMKKLAHVLLQGYRYPDNHRRSPLSVSRVESKIQKHGRQWAQRNVCCCQPHHHFVHRTRNSFNMYGIGGGASSLIAGGSVRVDWGVGSPSYPYEQNYLSSTATMARDGTVWPQKDESSENDDEDLDPSLKL